MSTTQIKSHKRINISLPEETLSMVDRIAEKGNRSRFIDEAVRFYVKKKCKDNLRQQLKEGATVRAERDLALAQEWFNIEEEACENDPR